jgi:hypothetical protein
MDKKDFIAVVTGVGTSVILLIEHWCGIGLALELLYIWGGITVIICLNVLRKFILRKLPIRKR